MSRTIDADALRKRIKAKNASNAMMKAMKAECIAEIDDAPTIEPERKKGEWWLEEYPDGYYHAHCSECNGQFPEEAYKQKWNFCPNCGADLREGAEQE